MGKSVKSFNVNNPQSGLISKNFSNLTKCMQTFNNGLLRFESIYVSILGVWFMPHFFQKSFYQLASNELDDH